MSTRAIAAAYRKGGGKNNNKDRLRFFRDMRGMTQRDLGVAVGFPEQSASIRIAQYECGARSPKPSLAAVMAKALDVAPAALKTPKIEDVNILIHPLFALEDRYGFQIARVGDELFLRLDEKQAELYLLCCAWYLQSALLERGAIDKSEYDQWRYTFTATVGGEAT